MKRIATAAISVAAFLVITPVAVSAAESDENFLKTAIGINLAEISMGQLAQKNGSTDGVRQFGATLVQDHTASNNDALALAKTHGFTPPTQPSVDDQKMSRDLSAMTGGEFDRAFAQDMVAGHQKAIQLFTAQAGGTKNDISSFAEKTLPTLKKHLATAQQLLSSSGGTAMTSQGAGSETAMSSQGSASQPVAGTVVEPSAVSANTLINTTVYDADNNNIGEVNDVILAKNGAVDAVVIDVGGFLGIGEKPVALAFDDLQFRRDGNGKLYVYSKFTQQQLESAPQYDKNTYEAQRDQMRVRSVSQ